MTTITIELRDEIADRLAEEAQRLNVSAQQMASLKFEQLYMVSDEDFDRLVDQIIDEDKELLRRLA